MTTNRSNAGPTTYHNKVEEICGRRLAASLTIEQYRSDISAEQAAVEFMPKRIAVTLFAFDVQHHCDDGRMDWHHAKGEFLDAAEVVELLAAAGVDVTLADKP